MHAIRALVEAERCHDVRQCAGSLGQHDERLCCFNDVRREFRGVAGADVFRCVNRPGRDEQRFTGLQRHRRRAVELIFQGAFEDVGDLRARMRLIHYPDDFDPAASVIEPLRQGRCYDV